MTKNKEFYFRIEGEYHRTTGARQVSGRIFPGQIARPSDDHQDIVEYAKKQMKIMYPRTKAVKVHIVEVANGGTGRESYRYDV